MSSDYDLDELYANTYTEEDRLAHENQPISEKKFLIAWLLALFLGVIGGQRYYLGHIPTAVLKTALFTAGVALVVVDLPVIGLAFIGIVGAWTVIDLFLLISGTMRDRAGRRLAGHARFGSICAAATVLVLVGILVVAMIIGTSTGVSG